MADDDVPEDSAVSKVMTPIEARSEGVSQVARSGGVSTSFPMIAGGTSNETASLAIPVAIKSPVISIVLEYLEHHIDEETAPGDLTDAWDVQFLKGLTQIIDSSIV